MKKDPANSVHAAYFISPHGFGHAARACAIMEALQLLIPNIHFDIYTQVPAWFFKQSNGLNFTYHSLLTDVGLYQLGPMQHDLPKTLDALTSFIGLCQSSQVDDIGSEIQKNKCKLIISDISPLGIIVARNAGIASVLVQNFTWDWLYQPYTALYPEFETIIDWFEGIYSSCSHIIRTTPFCHMPHYAQKAALTTQPVSRTFRVSRQETRRALGCPENAKLITYTMGGIESNAPVLEGLARNPDFYLLEPGRGDSLIHENNLIILPRQSSFHHPDIINASDLIIGKLGYSTLAETYYAGIPFWYLPRDDFRESTSLADFANRDMHGVAVPPDVLRNNVWLDRLTQSTAQPRIQRQHENGASQAATYIAHLL